MPPRHGKSELASINFPGWLLGNYPEKEIITVSYSAELALDFGSKTRDLVNSEAYQFIFNTRLKEDEKSKAKWRTEQKGSYTSVGMGGAITGRGADILLIDDPIKNAEEAASQVIRDKHWSWFTSTAYTRMEPGGRVIVIVTRWHLQDLAGLIMASEEFSKRVKVISFPAIAEVDEKHRKKGEALWPTRFPIAKLKEIKAGVGIYDWSSLYQQQPILSENQEFRANWFKYKPLEAVLALDTRKFATIDTALSEKEAADYTGVVRNYIDRENKWHLIGERYRLNSKGIIDLIFKLHDEGFEAIGVEEGAFTLSVKPFLDDEMRKRGKFPNVVMLKHKHKQKELRIRGLVPRYESGSIYHIQGRCADLEDELLTFPKSAYDDVADALAYQLQLAEKPEHNDQPVHIPVEPQSEFEGGVEQAQNDLIDINEMAKW